jgi:hypothetical protein
MPLRLLYASSSQINAEVPRGAAGESGQIVVATPSGASAPFDIRIAPATPGVFAVTAGPQAVTLWATGLGDSAVLNARIAGQPARVLFAGASPEFPGLDQVNIGIPAAIERGQQNLEVSLGAAAPFYSERVLLP